MLCLFRLKVFFRFRLVFYLLMSSGFASNFRKTAFVSVACAHCACSVFDGWVGGFRNSNEVDHVMNDTKNNTFNLGTKKRHQTRGRGRNLYGIANTTNAQSGIICAWKKER